MPEWVGDKLLNWASDLDDQTAAQAARAARLPFVTPHVALMPDAHLGLGATVGSVIPTEGAIIPAAVGVDIGCGMVAVETSLAADALPDSLDPLLDRIGRVVPAGVGRGHRRPSREAERWWDAHDPARRRREPLAPEEQRRALEQFGTLGAGNHYLEVCLDEERRVWVALHSGSRGIGNRLAQRHIKTAKALCHRAGVVLEDADLAYFLEGTPEFDAYLVDMLWAQDYARANRDRMMDVTLRELFAFVDDGHEIDRVNCHHNFTQRERHFGRDLWVTRKGAIRATADDRGVIPGSMGARSYIVRGRGEPSSFTSCAHGAGRRLSRREAKRRYSASDLTARMEGSTWNRDRAAALVDEIPDAYKDIDRVMEDQRDLVQVTHVLRQILNYKGS